jgi:hypothetical protein
MIVHLHASCWNEERMLPFFCRYYDRFVDHYFIHDRASLKASQPMKHRLVFGEDPLRKYLPTSTPSLDRSLGKLPEEWG